MYVEGCLDCEYNPGLCDTHDNIDTQMANMRVNPLFAGEIGSWTGVAVHDDHTCHIECINHRRLVEQLPRWIFSRWNFSPKLQDLVEQYYYPGGISAWTMPQDDLEDPAYDRLYDTPVSPSDWYDEALVAVKRWASRLFIDLPREIYFGRYDQHAVGPEGWHAEDGKGDAIHINRVVPLSHAQGTKGKHRSHRRRKPLRARRQPR